MSKRLRIAFVLPCDAPGGGIFVAYRHARYLHERGHDVTVLFTSPEAVPEARFFPGLKVRFLKLQDAMRFQRIGTLPAFDVVIATWWGTYFDMFEVKAESYSYFVQSDERRFYPETSFARKLVWMTYALPGVRFITEARWIQLMLRDQFGQDAAYAPNGVDNDMFHPGVVPLAERGKRLRLLIEGPGSLPYKRVGLTFQVASAIQKKFPAAEIWYVSGDGVLDPAWKAHRVFVKAPNDEMPAIYASCDILIKLSTVEGVFGPPLEMMASGGVSVVSAVTGIDEYIRDGQNALVVPLDDAKEAERAVIRLIQDPSLRKRLAVEGIKTAQNLDWKRLHCHFEDALFAKVEPSSLIQGALRFSARMIYSRYRRALEIRASLREKKMQLRSLLSR